MFELVAGQPGFLGYETARSDGLGITVAYFESEPAIAAWKANADHAAAQREGRARWYSAYEVHVASASSVRMDSNSGRMSDTPPGQIRLDETYRLRLFRIADAYALHTRVRESLEHLRPWMPWADEESGDETFQRRRLRGVQQKATTGEEWQYGLFPTDESHACSDRSA